MEKTPFPVRLCRALALAAAVCLAVGFLCVLSPALRRKGTLNAAGERAFTELGAFSTALSHYSGADLVGLTAQPKADARYKSIAGLLAQVRGRNDYKAMYLLFRGQNRQYQYLIDANYRDNAMAGSEYYAPATAYPTNTYTNSTALLGSLYAGEAAYVKTGKKIAARPGDGEVLCVYLPVYGSGGSVLAVLGVECDLGHPKYHMLGPINLRTVAWITLPAGLLCAVLCFLLARRLRETKRAGRDQASESALDGDGGRVPPPRIAPTVGQDAPAARDGGPPPSGGDGDDDAQA